MSERIEFVDVTLRDGHQSLWAERMTTGMMLPMVERLDRAGFIGLEVLSPSFIGKCVRDLHEDPIEQIDRMFRTELYGVGNDRDDQQRIRMDDWELREEVQHAVKLIWPTVTTANLFEHTDYASYKAEFLKLFGFGISGVDYAADVDPVVPFAVVDLAGH